MRLPVSAGAIRKLLQEIECSARGEHVLAVGGPPELASVLRQQFLRGRADPGAVRLDGPERAEVYVHVLDGDPGTEDEAALRRACRARVPVVAVARGRPRYAPPIPYVLATDVVWMAQGENFPLEAIAKTIAVRLGEDGAPLAARVPLLRAAVCRQLVSSFSRKNGLFAATIRLPGADLPVLALNELRLVCRLAQVDGAESGRELVAELAATLGAAFALRALARGLLDSAALNRMPFAGSIVKGPVAYAGTRALGEAACKRFGLASRPPRGATWRGAL
jgi:uncharacterized protein (DUF697 family)